MGIVLAPPLGRRLANCHRTFGVLRLLPDIADVALAVLLSFLFMPSKKSIGRLKFDFVGFILMCLSLFSLMLALSGSRVKVGVGHILILLPSG